MTGVRRQEGRGLVQRWGRCRRPGPYRPKADTVVSNGSRTPDHLALSPGSATSTLCVLGACSLPFQCLDFPIGKLWIMINIPMGCVGI